MYLVEVQLPLEYHHLPTGLPVEVLLP
jgi:hypothetical protein